MSENRDPSEGVSWATNEPQSKTPQAVSQDDIVAFLSRADAYPFAAATDTVEVFQTHGSWVFVVGEYAYKLKKAIDLGFFDYSTLERRTHFCHEEVRLNRRLAPSVYLGVAAVWRTADGALALSCSNAHGGQQIGSDSPDVIVESLVWMRRIAHERLLSTIVERRALKQSQLSELARRLGAFYLSAEQSKSIDEFGTPEVIRVNVEENFEQTETAVGHLIDTKRFGAIRSAQLSFLTLRTDVFAARIRGGWIRDCHGDLRAEHVAFLPEPVVVDCIEFAARLRYGDVVSDIAFLFMDLELLGHAEVARELLELYKAATSDDECDQVLKFYLSYRAFVRAKVDAIKLTQSETPEVEQQALKRRAQRLFELSYFHTLEFHRAQCILVSGLSGTGKTTLAAELSRRLGAHHLRSDVIRKNLAGLSPDEHAAAPYGTGIYSDEQSRRTYAAMERSTAELLTAGASVVVDATFSREALREEFQEAAHRAGTGCILLECTAPSAVVAARLVHRQRQGVDASDAGPELQRQQEAAYDAPTSSFKIDTSGSLDGSVRTALQHIAHQTRR